jgi:hypothetical protein
MSVGAIDPLTKERLAALIRDLKEQLGTVRICPRVSQVKSGSVLIRLRDPNHCGCTNDVPPPDPGDANGRCVEQQEKIMNKTTTHKDSLLPLEDHELDSVSGGTPAEQLQQEKNERDAMKAFQQALQELP